MGFRSFRQSQDARLEDVAALGRVAFAAGVAPDVPTLLNSAGFEVLRAFGADALALYLLDLENEELRAVYRVGTTPVQHAVFDSTPLRDTLAWQVALEGAPRCKLATTYPSDLVVSGIGATAAAPLKVQARVIGTLNISFRHERLLPDDRLRLLQVMAAHFAQALEAQRAAGQARERNLENAELYEELRSNAAELARLRAELAEKARLASVGELAAAVAHELRNPLAVLSNVVSLLAPGETGGASAELARAAREELGRMNTLVGDLLELARPSELSREPTQLAPLLQEVAQALGADPRSQAVRVEVSAEEGLPPAQVDPRRLRQVLLSLAQNGAQAMQGRGTLQLRARREGEQLRLEVADQGPGIPPDVQARLFQPSLAAMPSGAGLGLALVQRVVRQHGGTLALTSEPGRGTTFVIELPLQAR